MTDILIVLQKYQFTITIKAIGRGRLANDKFIWKQMGAGGAD